MKRCVFALFALLSTSALGQTSAVGGWCEQGAKPATVSGLNSTNKLQGIIPGCTVTVYFTGTSTQVPGSSIFADSIGTVLGNPFTANTTTGQYLFYAANGVGLDVSRNSGTTQTDVVPGGGSGGGSVNSVTASAPVLSSGGANPNISLPQASATASGYLGSGDWTTFNAKQNALINPMTGTGTAGQVPEFTGVAGATSPVDVSSNFVSAPLGCAGTSGSGAAYSCSTTPLDPVSDGSLILFYPDTASSAGATLAVNGGSALAIQPPLKTGQWGPWSSGQLFELSPGQCPLCSPYWQQVNVTAQGSNGCTNTGTTTAMVCTSVDPTCSTAQGYVLSLIVPVTNGANPTLQFTCGVTTVTYPITNVSHVAIPSSYLIVNGLNSLTIDTSGTGYFVASGTTLPLPVTSGGTGCTTAACAWNAITGGTQTGSGTSQVNTFPGGATFGGATGAYVAAQFAYSTTNGMNIKNTLNAVCSSAAFYAENSVGTLFSHIAGLGYNSLAYSCSGVNIAGADEGYVQSYGVLNVGTAAAFDINFKRNFILQGHFGSLGLYLDYLSGYGTECLTHDNTGLVTGTGSPCGVGPGSGTVNSGASGSPAGFSTTSTATTVGPVSGTWTEPLIINDACYTLSPSSHMSGGSCVSGAPTDNCAALTSMGLTGHAYRLPGWLDGSRGLIYSSCTTEMRAQNGRLTGAGDNKYGADYTAIVYGGNAPEAVGLGGSCTTDPILILTVTAGALNGGTIGNAGAGCGTGSGITWYVNGVGTGSGGTITPTWSSGAVASFTATGGSNYLAAAPAYEYNCGGVCRGLFLQNLAIVPASGSTYVGPGIATVLGNEGGSWDNVAISGFSQGVNLVGTDGMDFKDVGISSLSYPTITGGIAQGIYLNGGSISGSTGNTCNLTWSNGGTATIALTGPSVIASNTQYTVTAAGTNSYTTDAPPYTATLTNGTTGTPATCSGTANTVSDLTVTTSEQWNFVNNGSAPSSNLFEHIYSSGVPSGNGLGYWFQTGIGERVLMGGDFNSNLSDFECGVPIDWLLTSGGTATCDVYAGNSEKDSGQRGPTAIAAGPSVLTYHPNGSYSVLANTTTPTFLVSNFAELVLTGFTNDSGRTATDVPAITCASASGGSMTSGNTWYFIAQKEQQLPATSAPVYKHTADSNECSATTSSGTQTISVTIPLVNGFGASDYAIYCSTSSGAEQACGTNFRVWMTSSTEPMLPSYAYINTPVNTYLTLTLTSDPTLGATPSNTSNFIEPLVALGGNYSMLATATVGPAPLSMGYQYDAVTANGRYFSPWGTSAIYIGGTTPPVPGANCGGQNAGSTIMWFAPASAVASGTYADYKGVCGVVSGTGNPVYGPNLLTLPTPTGPGGTWANSQLQNSSTTVNGQTCTLGLTCTVTAAGSVPLLYSGWVFDMSWGSTGGTILTGRGALVTLGTGYSVATVNATATNPYGAKITSGTASTQAASITSGNALEGAKYPVVNFAVQFPNHTDWNTNARFQAGFSASTCALTTLTAGDAPACSGGYIYIRWSTTASDTTFQCVSSTGSGTPTVTAIGTTAPTDATTILMAVAYNASGATCVVGGSIVGGAVTGGTAVTNTTTLPSTANMWAWFASNIYPPAGTAINLDEFSVQAYYQNGPY